MWANEVAQNRSRTNIGLVDGRKYIRELGECASSGHDDASGYCLRHPNDTDARGQMASKMHACQGLRGGHPSLVVWDILEQLNRLLQ